MKAERPHRGWVNLLTVLVGLMAVLAVLSTWVDRQVFNTEEWGKTSVEMLQNPEIQAAVANYAVSELYANVDVQGEIETALNKVNRDVAPLIAGPLAGLGRQGADKLALKALQSEKIQNLWRQANEAAHKTLIDVIEDRSAVLSTGGGQVQLELRPLIIEIASQVGLEKQARDNIPASVGNVDIVDSQELASAQRVAKLIHGLALVSALLTLILLALAVFLSPGYRWITLIWLGVALIIAMAIVLILRSAGGGMVVDSLADPDIQPAAQAAWDIGTDLLRSIAHTIIWSSLILFLLAWLASPTTPAEHVRRFLAVVFSRFPWPVFGLFGLAAFIFLITGAGEGRVFLVRLMIVAIAALGLWYARRQLLLEHPDADLEGLRAFGDRTAGSARDLWQGPLRGVTRIFGSRGTGTDGQAEPPTAASATGAPAAEAPTRQLDGGAGSAPAGEGEDPTRVLPTGEADRFELLERLGRLRDSGVLSEQEFAAEKQRILGGG